MARLLPIDAHAHVQTTIDPRELRALRALVFAVTREPSEWAAAVKRRDRDCLWGLGCHPKVPTAFEQFDPDLLHDLLERCPLIGEVGLDKRAKVPMKRQVEVFRAVLDVAGARSRLVTIHSSGTSAEVINELTERPVAGAILHWWRGDPAQTNQAVELGCYFSLNGAEVQRPKVLSLLPPDRVLTETDYPHTRRQDNAANVPGAVGTTEQALAQAWGLEVEAVRQRLWQNLRELCASTATASLLPRDVQATLLTL
jgi:TatD DNase family protein